MRVRSRARCPASKGVAPRIEACREREPEVVPPAAVEDFVPDEELETE